MPLSGRPRVHDRHDLVAADVLGDQRRSREVGSGLAAHRVAPMAEAALRREERRASLDLLRRIRLRRGRLRGTKGRRTPLPAPLAGRRRQRHPGSSGATTLGVQRYRETDRRDQDRRHHNNDGLAHGGHEYHRRARERQSRDDA